MKATAFTPAGEAAKANFEAVREIWVAQGLWIPAFAGMTHPLSIRLKCYKLGSIFFWPGIAIFAVVDHNRETPLDWGQGRRCRAGVGKVLGQL